MITATFLILAAYLFKLSFWLQICVNSFQAAYLCNFLSCWIFVQILKYTFSCAGFLFQLSFYMDGSKFTMGMRCFCAQAQNPVDKSETNLAISSYAFPMGSVYGFGMKRHQRKTPANSESASKSKNLAYSQQSGPISHIVWTDSILIFISVMVFNLKN